MAVVYRAVSRRAARFRAHLRHQAHRPAPGERRRLRRIAGRRSAALGLLVHPGIVQVYELGEVDGEYYLAMEYVDGLSTWQAMTRTASKLRPRHAARRRLPPRSPRWRSRSAMRTRSMIGRRAAARHRPSRRQPVERHARPHGHREAARLRHRQGGRRTLRDDATRTGTLKGKISYMSPEQAEGHAIDRRSDIFSLGVVFTSC